MNVAPSRSGSMVEMSGRRAEPTRISATLAAHQAIARLRVALGRRVMFVHSAGCGAGSTPMCFPNGEFLVGDYEVLIGMIDGAPFYIDVRLNEVWGRAELVLDVKEGDPEGISLPAGEATHFVTTSTWCTTGATKALP